ncbi:MAG: type II toxin-antitoxin system PemK/MazF family toxin [Tatlockia sp.]|nr:type II toxin-antitoxin system PemK/MazF family toxin [Tatlockia sp.]
MAYIPEQGDLIWLDFDPSSGKEMMKRRPAFVISRKAFNEHTKMAIVAPITSTIRGIKLEVVLPDDIITDGAILVFQLKSVDFLQHNAEFIEKTSAHVIEQVSSIAQLLVQ